MRCEPLDIIYLRLSKEDGDVAAGTEEESCSIQSQRLCIHRHLESIGMVPGDFREIVDDGYSGTTMNRPGMAELLDLAEQGRVRTIVVRDLSRFARNYLDAGRYLEFVFPMYGVRFLSVNDQYDSAMVGESTGGLELAIRNLLNQMYSRDISRKIKSAVDLKKMNGEYVYGSAPYGYRKGDRKNTIEIDEPAAMIVRRIFHWASAGVSNSEIARRLNSEGVKTPSAYLAEVRGRYKTRALWSYESIRNILENRIYTGDTVPFKSHVVRVGSDRTRGVPVDQQVIIHNTHPPIIPRELFESVYADRKRYAPRKNDPSRQPYLFGSILVCGCCGNRLARGKAQNKDWLCPTRRYAPDTGCKDVRFPDGKLTEIVANAIRTQSRLLDARLRQMKAVNSSTQSDADLLRSECRKLRRELDQLQSQKMQRFEEFLSGAMTREQFLAIKEELTAGEVDITAQLQLAQSRLETLSAWLETADSISDRQPFAEYQELEELTHGLVKELVKEIVIYPGERMRIVWNYGDEVSALLSKDEYAVQNIP